MATNKPNTNGKGRVVTPAPKSAKGKSATTARKAGVPAKRSRKTHGEILATMRDKAGKAGNKLPYACVTLDDALALADTLPTLAQAGLWNGGRMSNEGAPRRAWAQSIGAPLVAVADVVHANKDGEIVHDRPENTVRARIAKRGEYAHKRADYYYAIRAEGYAVGGLPLVFIVRKGTPKTPRK